MGHFGVTSVGYFSIIIMRHFGVLRKKVWINGHALFQNHEHQEIVSNEHRIFLDNQYETFLINKL